MKSLFYFFLAFFSIVFNSAISSNNIVVGTSSMYPPFEYVENGELKGFDVELAKLIAKELGKEIIFRDMQFSTLFVSLKNHHIDAIIATLSVNNERRKNFDFSEIYYSSSISAIFKLSEKINVKEDLLNKKIASQLGSTMSFWLHKNFPNSELIEFNESNGAVEALKSGHVQVALVDSLQAKQFVAKNSNLSTILISESDEGYAIAVEKGSILLHDINLALKKLNENGELKKLKQKWFDEK